MTHCGGLSFSVIIWRIGGGGKFPSALGSEILLVALLTKDEYFHYYYLELLIQTQPINYLHIPDFILYLDVFIWVISLTTVKMVSILVSATERKNNLDISLFFFYNL